MTTDCTIEALELAIRARKAQEAKDGISATVDEPNILIWFQCGPVLEVGVNGITIEHVIDILIERLEGFQKGPLACTTNAMAIDCLEEANSWLERRTAERQARGVEGTYQI